MNGISGVHENGPATVVVNANIGIDDVDGLQEALDTAVTSPYASELIVSSFAVSQNNPYVSRKIKS